MDGKMIQELPHQIRSASHIAESRGHKLMSYLLSDQFIIRQVSERDYGIDYYIEIASTDNAAQMGIVGHLFSVQLKTVEKIDWKRGEQSLNDEARIGDIKVSSANYWNKLPVPVLLFVADLSESNVYICPAKEGIRRQYKNLHSNHLTMSFTLNRRYSLSTKFSQQATFDLYYAERWRDRIEWILFEILSNVRADSSFFLECMQFYESGRMHPASEMKFRKFYMSCNIISVFCFRRPWTLPALDQLLGDATPGWHPTGQAFLCKYKIKNIMRGFLEEYLITLQSCLYLVTEIEREYWEIENQWLFSMCCDQQFRRHIEEVCNQLSGGC